MAPPKRVEHLGSAPNMLQSSVTLAIISSCNPPHPFPPLFSGWNATVGLVWLPGIDSNTYTKQAKDARHNLLLASHITKLKLIAGEPNAKAVS